MITSLAGPVLVVTRNEMISNFSNGVISVLCFRLQSSRNLSSHCLGVNPEFPSVGFASSFGTVYLSAIVFLW